MVVMFPTDPILSEGSCQGIHLFVNETTVATTKQTAFRPGSLKVLLNFFPGNASADLLMAETWVSS